MRASDARQLSVRCVLQYQRDEVSKNTPLRPNVAATPAFPDGSMTALACVERQPGLDRAATADALSRPDRKA